MVDHLAVSFRVAAGGGEVTGSEDRYPAAPPGNVRRSSLARHLRVGSATPGPRQARAMNVPEVFPARPSRPSRPSRPWSASGEATARTLGTRRALTRATTQQVLAVAHRGASDRAPENTLAAVRLGADLGADAIEVDLQRTRDGALVLLHDSGLARTTDVATRFRRPRPVVGGQHDARRGAPPRRRQLEVAALGRRAGARRWRRR